MTRDQIEAHVRRLYTTYDAGDEDAYRANYAPDFTWHVPGDNPVSGAYRGHDEYFGTMVGRMAPLDEWRFEVTGVETNERDNAALVAFHLVGRRKGRTVDTDGHHMIRLDAAGRIVEGWGFTADQAGLDAFFTA